MIVSKLQVPSAMFRDNNIVVVGAGAGGLACALSAARRGASVHLLEQGPRLGGTVAHSLIHTLGGLYDDSGQLINPGLPEELIQRLSAADAHCHQRQMGRVWVFSVEPTVYEQTVADWLAEYSNLTVLRNSRPVRVHAQDGRIRGLTVAGGGQSLELGCDALVDATGSAAVVRAVDPSRVSDGEALAGLIFQLRGVAAGALAFPRNIGVQRRVQQAVTAGDLPQVCATAWLDTGVYPDEVYVKLSLAAADFDPRAVARIRHHLPRVLGEMPDFADARLVRTGELGIRDGGSIDGRYRLTVDDVKAGREFPHSVGRCAWPIEYWDPHEGVSLDYLPPGHAYRIPLDALRVAGMDNLWVAGKCLSADKLAQASARVAGSCWAMGDGLGRVLAA